MSVRQKGSKLSLTINDIKSVRAGIELLQSILNEM
jgi:hypothetical protein